MRISMTLIVPVLLSFLAATGAQAAGQGTRDALSQTSDKPDNTGVNARDKNSAASTPQKQGNTKSDVALLAAVRKSVVRDKSLSLSAHNVKLLVANGAVTLRGPVVSADEKTKVEALVKQVNGVTSVDNQLDVKSK